MASQAETNALAHEAYAFWRGKGASHIQALALLGNEDGEVSFRPFVVGDHGEAHGIFQWHTPRILGMLKGCGIDVRTASHADQLRAAFWEMSAGSYRSVWPRLQDSTTLWSAVSVLVSSYEGSANQPRDIQRRVGLAEGWGKVIQDA